MTTAYKCALFCILIPVLSGCVSMPTIERPRYTQRHYVYTVLLTPESPANSPHLDLALSLVRMEYPAEQAHALHETLYGQASLDAYKDSIISELRKNYRERAADVHSNGNGAANFNWRYAERYSVKQAFDQGIVIERELETYFGGANYGKNTQYYNIEFGADGFRQVAFDNLFDDYQDDQRLRDVVYHELREYSKLDSSQPLSRGIFFTNEPELSFNFFITEDGLGLHWDPAQIAPHSEGSINIILPWYALSALLLYESIEMLAHKFDIHLF